MINHWDLLWVRSGELSFTEFAKEATPDFRRLATKLCNARTLPPSIDVDDVVQVMLMAVPPTLAVWREGDYDLRRFVIMRAIWAARKYVKRARKYQVKEDQARLDLRLSEVVSTDEDLHDEFTDVRKRVKGILSLAPRTSIQKAALESLARTQCVKESLKELLGDPRTARMFQGHTTRMQRMKLRRLMHRLAAQSAEVRG